MAAIPAPVWTLGRGQADQSFADASLRSHIAVLPDVTAFEAALRGQA